MTDAEGPADSRGWMRALPGGKAISALGFGCSSLWAKPAFGDERAAAILDALAEEGVNHFDTGPSYGNGTGERRLGQWLAKRDAAQLVISTKVGTNLIDGAIVRGFSPDLLLRSFEASMARLGLEQVDVLYLHGPAPADLTTGVFDLFERLKADGRIGLSGINSFDNAVLLAACESPVDAVMLQYNVADFRNRAAMALLHQAGKTIFSGTALARARFAPGALLPTSREKAWYLLRLLKDDPLFALRSRTLARRLEATGKPPVEAALQFLCGDPMVVSSLFGTSSAGHARSNAKAGHGQLSNRVWTALADCA